MSECSNLHTLFNVLGGMTTPTTPPGSGGSECSFEGEILSNFNYTSTGGLFSRYEGHFEICIGGFYGSVCDIGWNQAAAQALCRDRFGSNYGKLLHFIVVKDNVGVSFLSHTHSG